jgi:hypothetical protein
MLISLLLVAPVLVPSITAQNGNPAFQRTWERTDKPVADGAVSRTWIWGELVTETALMEAYDEAPGGQRQVLYYDKARMEDNSYRAPDAPWDVTNGLLVVELATGMMQTGDGGFEERSPSDHNVAGDADDPTGPTYTTIAGLMDAPAHAEGATIDWTVVRDGTIGQDPTLGAQGVTAGPLSPETGHRTASVFWEFMTSSGPVWVDEQLVTDTLFPSAYYATGLPITEAYWASVKVGGTYRIVLLQCFERRCLTYTPDNPEGWRTEMGNVGQHYHAWRYTTEQHYQALFGLLNDSGVTGFAELTLVGNELTIEFDLSGLEPGQSYDIDIHGPQIAETGSELQTLAQVDCPTPDMASDDGILTEEEGAAAYGRVVVGVVDSGVWPDNPSLSEPIGPVEWNAGSLQDDVFVFFGQGDDSRLPLACATIEPPGAYERGEYSQTYIQSPGETGDVGSFGLWAYEQDDISGGSSTFWDYRATLRGGNGSERLEIYGFYGPEESRPDCSSPIFDTNGDGEVSGDEARAYLRAVDKALLFDTEPTDEDGEGVREVSGALHVPPSDEGDPAVFVFDGETDQMLGCGVVEPVGPGTQFGAFLVGGEEVPPVESNAFGFVVFNWLPDNTFSYNLIGTGLTGVTAAHIHDGVFGENGPVIAPLYTPDEPTGAINGMFVHDGSHELPQSEPFGVREYMLGLLSQSYYANVHTSEYPDGELRGQLGVTIPDVYTAPLTGDQVVPPVDTEMSGSVAFLVNPELETISFQLITANGVDVTSAHIHLGEPGENGDEVAALYDLDTHGPRPKSGILWQGPITADALIGPLSGEPLSALIELFEDGEAYVCVATEEHPDGEIRGRPEK